MRLTKSLWNSRESCRGDHEIPQKGVGSLEICLDTDVLIDFLRGKEDVVKKVLELEEEHELSTTSVNIFELYYGAYRSGRERNIEAVHELKERIEVLRESRGERIDFRDALIAGIVIENDVALFTRNVRHFARVEGLKLHSREL